MDRDSRDEWMLQVLGEMRRIAEATRAGADELRRLRVANVGTNAAEDRETERLKAHREMVLERLAEGL